MIPFVLGCSTNTKRQNIIEDIKLGQILICNDTLINCKIDQIDKRTEINVFSIAFLNTKEAIIHSFSSAGHTEEELFKVKYTFQGKRLTIFFPDKYLTLNKSIGGKNDRWNLSNREKDKIELEIMECNGQNIFKVPGANYYCGSSTSQEYSETYDDIMEIVNSSNVAEILKKID